MDLVKNHGKAGLSALIHGEELLMSILAMRYSFSSMYSLIILLTIFVNIIILLEVSEVIIR